MSELVRELKESLLKLSGIYHSLEVEDAESDEYLTGCELIAEMLNKIQFVELKETNK